MEYVIFQTDTKTFVSFRDGKTVIYGDINEANEDCRKDGLDIVVPIFLEMGGAYHVGDKIQFKTYAGETFIGTISKILVFEKAKKFSSKRIPYQSISPNNLESDYDFNLHFEDIGMWCRSRQIIKKIE